MTKKEEKSNLSFKERWQEARKQARDKEKQVKQEQRLTNRILKYLILGLVILVIIGAGLGFWYVNDALKAMDPNNHETVAVTIPVNSSTKDVTQILQDAGIIKNSQIFNYYMRFNNDKALQAGHYEFSKDMNAAKVMETIQAGGEPIFVDADTKLTVVEGMTADQIAEMVGENTAISADDFMKELKNEDYLEQLRKKYPSLLEGLADTSEMKVPLEGYLYPATYDYFAGMSAQELIEDMVAASNLVYQELKDDLVNTTLNYHQVLTLASLIEREAVTEEDRGLVSGVFYNRISAEMPLQSDISVLYALGVHKEKVTYDDLEVDSPYNLYKNTGLAPGPMNSPSKTAIVAAIYPTWNEYYYFVADIETQKIYYSTTIEEHNALVEQYVNDSSESTDGSNQEEQASDNQDESNQ